MGSEEVAGAAIQSKVLGNPWPALLGGLAANIVACFWFEALGKQALPLLLPGLLATGAAVAIRPRSALVLGLAALSGLFAFIGIQDWDSAHLLVGVLSAVAAFAALVVLLPTIIQRVIVSIIIVVHFVGILSAVSSVPPTPALMNWAWTYFYRPYLQFMYLNNAYHFYSPEPGPGVLVWFYVRYDDGSADWYKIPNRAENPLAQEYQRRLSLVESTNQLQPPTYVPPDMQDILQRRSVAAHRDSIPLYPGFDVPTQRREPNPYSKEMLQTYARYVAHYKARETGKAVRGVKIYRVIHNLPTAEEIAEGIDPTEKHFYYPYYQGEFTAEGQLKDPHDPYLYWLIPIVKTHDVAAFRAGRLRLPAEQRNDLEIVDLLEEHARLLTESSADPKPDFVPGGPAQAPPQTSASTNPLTTSFRR
jgi:hypothetical protein